MYLHREIIDKIVSTIGLVLAAVLLATGIGLNYANSFISGEVRGQLSSQKIYFPSIDDEAFSNLPDEAQKQIRPFAGQQLVDGAGAAVFANHYINTHLSSIGGGLTYSELSEKSMANPDDKVLAGKVDTMFRGETLRGMLLNAYAFSTMAHVAKIASFISFGASVILIFLSALGFGHAKKTSSNNTIKTNRKRTAR